MRTMCIIIIAIASWFLVDSCRSSEMRYIEEAYGVIKKNSLYRDSADWRRVKQSMTKNMKGAHNIADAHNEVYNILSSIGDKHSMFFPPDKKRELDFKKMVMPPIESELLDNAIGYIKIPPFLGNDSTNLAFANHVQAIICEYERKGVSHWIVDLQNNLGGNMWPMFCGLGPLLGEGVHGFFVGPDGTAKGWRYTEKGEAFEGDKKWIEIQHPYRSQFSKKKIAILINGQTASSGEAIAVAFKAKYNTRFFGVNTYGLVTSNDIFTLSDGADLYLTVSYFADSEMKVYRDRISPDELSEDSSTNMTKAKRWLVSN